MNDLKIVKEILAKHINLEENVVYLFGSRVSGTHRDNSDLDILVIDKTIAPDVITRLEEAFEESDLTYKVDLVFRSRIDDEFYEKIKDQLKAL